MLKLILMWILKLILERFLRLKFWPCESNPSFLGRPIFIQFIPVGVEALGGAEAEQLVEEVHGKLVLDIGSQALLHPPPLVLRDLQLAVEVQVLHPRPDVRGYGAAELRDESQLVLFRVALHDGRSGPHFCHYATRAPEVDGRAVIPLSQEQLGRAVPEGYHTVGVAVRLVVLLDGDGPS